MVHNHEIIFLLAIIEYCDLVYVTVVTYIMHHVTNAAVIFSPVLFYTVFFPSLAETPCYFVVNP